MNNFNPFSGLLNPIYTLKSAKEIDPAAVLAVMDKDDPHEPTVSKYYGAPPHMAWLTHLCRHLPPPAGCEASQVQGLDSHSQQVRPSTCFPCCRSLTPRSGGVYSIMFSEEIKEDNFIISPRVDFVVNVKILGGLMVWHWCLRALSAVQGLGYQVGAIIHRQSTEWRGKKIIISFDKIEELGRTFLQIKGFDRQVRIGRWAHSAVAHTYHRQCRMLARSSVCPRATSRARTLSCIRRSSAR